MFDIGHLLNIVAEKLMLDVWMYEMYARGIARYLKRGSKNMLYGSNKWYPPVDRTYSDEPLFKYAQPISGYHSLEDKIHNA